MSKKQKKPKNVRGGALMMIASFMIISAVVRLGAETGPALSRLAANAAETEDAMAAKSEKPAEKSGDHPMEVGPLLTALKDRESALSEREHALEDRLQALRIAEQAVEQRITALQEAEERLRATLAVADGASERDLSKLTSVYEQMKSKEAAAMFEEMAPEFAAGFLARMRPEVAASVLEGMNPKAAYSVSVVLAGRNMQVPTE